MSGMSFGDAECAGKKQRTGREAFLAEMGQVHPWGSPLRLIEPLCPLGGLGRPPYPPEKMLWVHMLKYRYTTSDPARAEALYDGASMRCLAKQSLDGEIPHATTILNFRRLLEVNELASQMLVRMDAQLARMQLMPRQGTIVDATIIPVPDSTKKTDSKRETEALQTKKCDHWHSGINSNNGVDNRADLEHTSVTTPENEADIEVVIQSLQGEESTANADAGHTEADKPVAWKKPTWQFAASRGQVQAMPEGCRKVALARCETAKPSIRVRVEPPLPRDQAPVRVGEGALPWAGSAMIKRYPGRPQ